MRVIVFEKTVEGTETKSLTGVTDKDGVIILPHTYYSAVDTVYQKGKHFAENKLKQHRQQVKTRQNSDAPNTRLKMTTFQRCRTQPSSRAMLRKQKRAYKRSINHLHTKMLQRCKTHLPHGLRPKKRI